VLGVLAGLALVPVLLFTALYWYVRIKYLQHVVRIFKEKPLFIIPRGQPVDDAEDVRLPTADGLTLRGVYLKTPQPRRQGVILFGLEFGSNRWSCVPYTEFLRARGYDVFAFEPRGQGDSDPQPGYEPLQWVTEFELRDFEAAIKYLKSRPDRDPRGVGLFGISKGGSAGLIAASRDRYLRCFVTDGVFATHTTMVPYMKRWIGIYNRRVWAQKALPSWFYGLYARAGLRRIRRERGVRFPHLEHAMRRLGDRPLLMIHGGADNYIKPEMAEELFAQVSGPKTLWMVEKAKHNQAFHLAQDEYQNRVLAFFQRHLGGEPEVATTPTTTGAPQPDLSAAVKDANGTTAPVTDLVTART
jgi:pimeloyl-ACP methyl ester carboxylesterase